MPEPLAYTQPLPPDGLSIHDRGRLWRMRQALYTVGLTEASDAMAELLDEVQKLQDWARWRCACPHERGEHYGDDHPSNWHCGKCDCAPGLHLVLLERAAEEVRDA